LRRAATAEPEQVMYLPRVPYLPCSVVLRVRPQGSTTIETWEEIDDLAAAGPEVPVTDPKLPPGAPLPPPAPTKVFAFDPEARRVKFGDGTHGTRLQFRAAAWADYDVTSGEAGNVGPGAIATGPMLPAGMKVTNPVRTWGGAEAETVAEGEKQVPRVLGHPDR